MRWLWISAFCFLSSLALAKKPPLYELGIGLVGGMLPKYPGSEESFTAFVPGPAVRYRGELLRSDEKEGTRLEFMQGPFWRVLWSGDASLPAKSSQISAREGMKDLKLAFGVGPRLHMFMPTSVVAKVTLDIVARPTFHTNWHRLHYLGPSYGFGPGFSLWSEDNPILFSGLVYMSWADARFQRYYYDVSVEDERPTRAQYRARFGYFRTECYLSLGWRSGLWSWFFSQRYERYHGNPNVGSPLLRRKVTQTTLFAVGYFLHESDLRAGDFY